MSYWRVASFAQPSPIEQILCKESFTLEELLDEDDIIQECKSLNESLLRFLSEPSTVEALLHYLVDDIPADGLADPKRAYKFPFAACEVLCCELDGVFDALVADEALLDLLFSPLRRPPPLGARAAGYLGRVAGALLLRKTGEMMQYLSFRGESVVCRGMVRHVGSAGVAGALRRLAGADDQSAVLFMPAHTQWLAETPLVEALLARMAYAGEAEQEQEAGGGGEGGEGDIDEAPPPASPSSSPPDESGAAVYDEAYCAEVRANAADILTAIAHTQPSALAAKLSRPECVSLLLGRVLPLAPGEEAAAAAAPSSSSPAAQGGDEAGAEAASESPAAVPPAGAEAEAAAASEKQENEVEEEERRRPAAAAAAAAATAPAAAAAVAAPPAKRQHPDELMPALEVCSALLEPRRSQMVIGGGPDGMGGGDYGMLGGGMLGDDDGGQQPLGGGEDEGRGGGGEGGGGDAGGPGPDTLAAVLAYVPALVRFLTDYGGGGDDNASSKAQEQQQQEQEQQKEEPAGANGGAAAGEKGAASSPSKKPAAAAGGDAQPAKDSDAEAGDDEDGSGDDDDDEEGDSKAEAAAKEEDKQQQTKEKKTTKKRKSKEEDEEEGDKAAAAAAADPEGEEDAESRYPDPAFVQETTYGLLRPPLGRARLRAVELLAAILRAGGAPAADSLACAGAVRALMRLFESHPFNNLLHHAFGSVVLAALARGGDTAAKHLLGDPCRLPGWLASLPREVWPALRPGQPKARDPLRAGYLGHVTQIGNLLLDAAAASPRAAELLAESPEWAPFVAGELAAANAAEDVGAWACGRPSSVELGPLDGGGGGGGADEAAMMMMGGDEGGSGGSFGGSSGSDHLERLAAGEAGLGSGSGGALYHRYGVLEEEEEEEEGGVAATEAGGGAVAAEERGGGDDGGGGGGGDDEAGEAARALQGLSVAEAEALDGATAVAGDASAASDDDAVLLASDNEGEEGGEGGAGGGGAAAGSPSPPPAAAAPAVAAAAPSPPASSSSSSAAAAAATVATA